MNRYDELSADCQSAVDRLVNTIASIHCDEQSVAWIDRFRGRIMDNYNFFIPRKERKFLQEVL
tara:strand:- start:235 stop:423 length:189 start_codon:yes stop_codon:yes gene_type:complete